MLPVESFIIRFQLPRLFEKIYVKINLTRKKCITGVLVYLKNDMDFTGKTSTGWVSARIRNNNQLVHSNNGRVLVCNEFEILVQKNVEMNPKHGGSPFSNTRLISCYPYDENLLQTSCVYVFRNFHFVSRVTWLTVLEDLISNIRL